MKWLEWLGRVKTPTKGAVYIQGNTVCLDVSKVIRSEAGQRTLKKFAEIGSVQKT